MNCATATVVRMDIQIGTATAQSIYVQLFDTDEPVTVGNFLNYVDDGSGNRRYDGSIIQRSVPGFILQGGGYDYDSALGNVGPASVTHIHEDAPIANEFNPAHSNLAGTLAMARIPGDPNSATSEWYFNAVDNTNLDSVDGGFTVFGKLLGSDLDVVQSVLALRTVDLGSPLSELPVADTYVTPNPVTGDDLVYLNTVTVNPPGHLAVLPKVLDFDLVDPSGAQPVQDVTVQNVGASDVTLGQVATGDPLNAPFSVTSDHCSNVTLASLQTCTLSVTFDLSNPGVFSDTFDIPSNAAQQGTLSYRVTGIVQANTPTLEIKSGPDLDFGAIGLANQSTRSVMVRNIGTGSLSPSAGAISGTDAADFSVTNDGCATTSIDVGATCAITLALDGQSLGTKTAGLIVNASPGSQSAQVNLTGVVRPSQATLTLPATQPYPIGDAGVGASLTSRVPLTNSGMDSLIISGITVEGPDATDFSVGGVCQTITSGSTCQETVTFTPSTTGDKTATLRILSNDPTSPTLLPITATGSTDNDGIPDAVEDAGPNGGDANHDGIPDSQQNNIATFPDIYGQYLTLEVSSDFNLVGVRAYAQKAFPKPPVTANGGTVSFPLGYLGFKVENINPGSIVNVTLLLPPGTRLNAYLKYGPPPGLFFSTWYLFPMQNGTGAELSKDRVVLHLQDGGRGDHDGVADGRIVDPGGPALVTLNNSSSSGGCTMNADGDATSHHRLDGWLVLAVVLLLRFGGRRRVRGG